MALINQLELYLQPTYKPLKCPSMVTRTVKSTANWLFTAIHEPPSTLHMLVLTESTLLTVSGFRA